MLRKHDQRHAKGWQWVFSARRLKDNCRSQDRFPLNVKTMIKTRNELGLETGWLNAIQSSSLCIIKSLISRKFQPSSYINILKSNINFKLIKCYKGSVYQIYCNCLYYQILATLNLYHSYYLNTAIMPFFLFSRIFQLGRRNILFFPSAWFGVSLSVLPWHRQRKKFWLNSNWRQWAARPSI